MSCAYELKVKEIETTLRGKSDLQASWEIKLCKRLFPNTGCEIKSFVNADELNWIDENPALNAYPFTCVTP